MAYSCGFDLLTESLQQGVRELTHIVCFLEDSCNLMVSELGLFASGVGYLLCWFKFDVRLRVVMCSPVCHLSLMVGSRL